MKIFLTNLRSDLYTTVHYNIIFLFFLSKYKLKNKVHKNKNLNWFVSVSDPQLVTNRANILRVIIQSWSLTSLEFVNRFYRKQFSCKILSTKDNTDLAFDRKLQAFKKASSLKGFGRQAQNKLRYPETFQTWSFSESLELHSKL